MNWIVHTRETKNALAKGGAGLGAALAVVAGAGSVVGPQIAVAAAAGALVSLAAAAYGWLAREDVGRLRRPTTRDASPEDIATLHDRLTTGFTPRAVPLPERLKIAKKCPGAYRVIEDDRDGLWRLHLDILAVYPLTAAAMSRVLEGSMVGADVRSVHISRTFKSASGLYVSFAEGRTPTTRTLVVEELLRAAESVQRRPLPIATIPTTDKALRITRGRGFRTLSGGEPNLHEVCVLHYDGQGFRELIKRL